MVYISTETDISALTNPNKEQAVCYPANAGGGDKERREEERGGEDEWLSRNEGGVFVSTISTSLAPSQRRETAVSSGG